MKARVVGRPGSISIPRRVVEAEELDVYEFRLGAWLSTHESEFCANVSQREMARRLRMSNGVTERALAGLEKLGVVTVERPQNTRSVSVTFSHEAWEALGQLTGRRAELTGRRSVGDRETVTKDKQGEIQESVSSTPSPPRKRDEIWDALVEVAGPVSTEMETARRGKCVKQLKDVGATARDVRERAREMQRRWPRVTLTDTGLVGRWSSVEPGRDPNAQHRSNDGVIYT